jgi:hypothetical protein
MKSLRSRVLSLLGAAALTACGSSGGSGTSTSSTSGTGGATSATTASGTGGHAGSGGDADGGLILDLDGGSSDAATCTQLNIGILGNPGANASSNFQQWLISAGTSVQRIQTTAAEPLTAATLQPFDVVILDWLTRDYDATEAATFALWVGAGGGVASMTGYNNTSADWHANSLLAPLQVAYGGPLLNGPVTSFATHPITAGLTSVTFAGGYEVKDLGGSGSTRTPIAFLPGNVTAGIAVQSGLGHGFVWGDEWIEFDSEWATLPEIKQLWVQVFGWISPANKCALTPPS